MKRRKYLYWLITVIMVLYVLPNLFNSKEKQAFSESKRLKQAKESSEKFHDSIVVIPGEYYKRGKTYTYFFGERNRSLWTTPVQVRVFNYDTAKGGLIPFEIGGSQQTISIRLKDSLKKEWTLRSVNKDQQNVLPGFLRPSLFRSLFRDQVSAMNPYAPLIASKLADALQLPHFNPKLYWVPFNEKYGNYNERIAGRLVYLEEHLNESWKGDTSFRHALDIVDTDDMEELQQKEKTSIDTLLYLKTRLFDMLINDWDRHEDQWVWILINDGSKKKFIPLGRDRDNALYIFDEGIVSKLTLFFNNKFQSFRKDFDAVDGLVHQAKKLDKKVLHKVSQQQFIALAKEIQQQLTQETIHNAFMQYPPAIYAKVGKLHEEVLQSRLRQLTDVAKQFHKLVADK